MSTLTVGTISEKVTDAGVAVDGVTLKDGGATFTSAVGVTGNTTITSGNLVIGTSGNGIDFSANSNQSGMTSEILNSYEEGTWTMTDQSGAGLSLTVFVSSYTKIGNQVFFEFGMIFPTTSNTNAVSLSLPFTAKATSDNTGGGGITVNSSGRTDTLVVIRNTATMSLQSVSNVSATNANYSGKQLRVAGQYTV
tara:strand:+ start:529 stop:1110 length:582 start_codon:yes stop_codon:yes gene_type:complete